MHKKRNVLLFGAGAVQDWNAPGTPKLTTLVRTAGFFCNDNKTTITEYIYQSFIQNGYNEKEITFETILNVIEELIVYYSYFNKDKKLPSIPKVLFCSKQNDFLWNFSFNEDEFENNSRLQIPKGGEEWLFQSGKCNNETQEQYFLQLLLEEILRSIIKEISKYAYHIKEDYSKVICKENNENNQLFADWIKQINGNDILRMYSLNYDRNFKIILEKLNKPISIFEGFDCNEILNYSSKIEANIIKILTDTECNIHYNLHGSAFWKMESTDKNGLYNPTFYLTEAPVYQISLDGYPNLQSEKGKTIMLTNFIAGYQKTQRGIFSPFRQMQSAFDKDCCCADNIYIIGYSFNDEHINSIIKTAIQYNKKNVKIIIINPSFTIENDGMKIFPFAGDANEMNLIKIQNNQYSFYNDKFIVHTKKFKEYLIWNVCH